MTPLEARQLTLNQAAASGRHSTDGLIVLDEPLMTSGEAAQLLRVRVSWIYDAVRDGRLPCLRVGRHIRFTRPILEQWLTEHMDTRNTRNIAQSRHPHG
jgi:excisionase family DNA binding protein